MQTKQKKRAPYRETKRLKAHERKQVILNAAKEVLIMEGYSSFSLRYVAEKSGIRLATLQYYYSSKEQLFRAAFEDALNQERDRINGMVSRAGNSPEKVLKARISGHFKANINDETAGFFYQLWARAKLDKFAAELMDEFYERNGKIVAELIRNLNSSLSAYESKKRATFVMATLEGMMLMSDIDKRKKGKFVSSEKYVVNALMKFATDP